MNIKRWLFVNFIVLCTAWLLGTNVAWAVGGGQAPGAPGSTSVWSYAGKQGIGTSYEQYVDNSYQDDGPTNTISKVWFSLAQGIVTETAYGEIDQAQIKDLEFLVTGNGFFDEEKVATDSTVDYLDTDSNGRPLSPAYRLVNSDKEGKYTIEKHVFTDPDRQTLFTRVIFTANEDNITPYILVNPHMENTGTRDVAFVGEDSLNAREDEDVYLSVKSSIPFVQTSAGYVGSSDGYQDLALDGNMDWTYDYTDQNNPGNVAMMAQLPTMSAGQTATFDLVVGFGGSYQKATAQADGSLSEGYDALLAKYNGTGSAVGWEDYLASLSNVPDMISQTGDNGKQLYASAFVLKTMEDKSNAGALIASLSVPWGDTVNADTFATGYRAVWPRDFYQVAMALLALGDNETPLVAFEYLPQVQVKSTTPGNRGATGWFLQKTHVDGTLEWIGIQLDQTAMPIMLGWKLWQAGILSDSQISNWYDIMLKPAAQFLSNGGVADINGTRTNITPPRTQQERWEEQYGYSPSTTAAIITGLVTAADIAENAVGDSDAAAFYLSKADEYQSNVGNFMFTTSGLTNFCDGSGDYLLRITQNENPNDGANILGSNGKNAINETFVVDGGFLELVRYGIKPGNDENIAATVCQLDHIENTSQTPDIDPENLKVRYEFTFDGNQYPGFRRYGNDGYGERTNDGGSYVGGDIHQRGRVWPFFTGERGHYELELAKANNGGTISDSEVAQLSDIYVRAMEYFANDSFMLPEQVWDGVGSNETYNYTLGEGTDSATPLAWTHAEYIKLVKSLTDKNIWDSYEIVKARY